MARQVAITEWILRNQNEMNLQVTKFTWIDRVLPGMIDLSVNLTIAGHSVHGRGSDTQEEVALGKAVSEALEKLLCLSHGISSTGLAGHLSIDQAKDEALREFIERATLAKHFTTQSRFYVLSSKSEVISVLGEKYDGKAHHFRLTAPQGYEVVLVVYEATEAMNPFGGVLGLGCERTLVSAIKKAEIECLRSLSALALLPIGSLSLAEFQKLSPKRGEHRKRLFLDPSYCRAVMNLIQSFQNGMGPISLDALSFVEINLPNEVPGGCPLNFVRCLGTPTLDESVLEFVG